MIPVLIGKKKYNFPTDWSDVTCKEFLEQQELQKEMPESLETKQMPKKGEPDFSFENELPEELEFKRKWICLMGNVPEDVLSKNILMHDRGELLGFYTIYRWLATYQYVPELPIQDEIEHKGKIYALPIDKYDAMGAKIPMGYANFGEWAEASELKRLYGNIENKVFSAMPKLTAIVYRPKKTIYKKKLSGIKLKTLTQDIIEDYDTDKANARAKEFIDLPMDKVWSAYFFLTEWSNTLAKNTISLAVQDPQLN